MEALHERVEAAECQRLTATEGHLQRAGLRELRENAERVPRCPRALGFDVPRAEAARQIARVGDAELHEARSTQTPEGRRRTLMPDGQPRTALEEELRAIEIKATHSEHDPMVRTFQREGVGWFLVCFVSISFVSIPVTKRGSSSVPLRRVREGSATTQTTTRRARSRRRRKARRGPSRRLRASR